ncbi:transposase [Paenibacillus dendritiformis C454]|uniref:Transposase n=1 Tax=Paenibacillus dendritiformis C454 TaxID=1131935 RepID=H3S9C8_9BACL|nr:transposase [Paenibacillus dendritiformis C454]
MIRDYQALQRTWFEKGKQRVIRTTGKDRGVNLLATVDYCTVLKEPQAIIDRLCVRMESNRAVDLFCSTYTKREILYAT